MEKSLKLTSEIIRKKSRCKDIFVVKNLNLWGSDIEDISIMGQMPNIEVLSLGFNNITTIKPLAGCLKLKELFLRKNQIQELKDIKLLSKCRNLKVLWLAQNPCCDAKDYRLYVIKHLPQL